MRNPTEFEIALGRHFRSKFGGETKVIRHGDDTRRHDVFVVSGADCPSEGVTSFATVGLSGAPQFSGEQELLVEIVAACASGVPDFANLVSSCYFDSVKNGANISYGEAIENIVDQYGISRTLRHVTFVSPFLWDDDFSRISVLDREIYCLLMVPISDKELEFLYEQGIDALEEVFDTAQIDVFDINRPSAL